ncbi:hypothetical protein MTR67_006817, partial [Solanum verrucosum]
VLGRAEGAKDALLGLQYFSLVCGSSSNTNVLQGRTGFQTAEGREGHGVCQRYLTRTWGAPQGLACRRRPRTARYVTAGRSRARSGILGFRAMDLFIAYPYICLPNLGPNRVHLDVFDLAKGDGILVNTQKVRRL